MVQVLTSKQLVDEVGGRARARTLVARGDYQRVLRGAYVLGAEDPDDPAVRAAAARVVLPSGAALSHRAALWVLGEDVLRDGLLDITVPRGHRLAPRPGLRTHSADLPPGELVLVEGVLSVSAARAVVDVARSSTLLDGVAFGDRALRLGAADLAGVEAALDRAAGLRGVLRARDVLPLLDGRSESWKESLLRVSLVLGGLEGLQVQFDAYGRDGHVGRADLYVRGVWIEYDGRAQRLDREVFRAERRRQNAIAELGVQVRRFTDADVPARSPASLVAEVRRAEQLVAGADLSRLLTGPDTLRPPRLSPLPTLADLARDEAA